MRERRGKGARVSEGALRRAVGGGGSFASSDRAALLDKGGGAVRLVAAEAWLGAVGGKQSFAANA